MVSILFDDKKDSSVIKKEITSQVELLKKQGKETPHFIALVISNDSDAVTQVKNTLESFDDIDFRHTMMEFEEMVPEFLIQAQIESLNPRNNIDGFIIKTPLPEHISEEKIVMTVLSN